MNKTDRAVQVGFWVLLSSLLAVCAFFIIHNAAWLVGDDAIVMKHTGFGNPFRPQDSVFKESGRFFPFSYLMYNVLMPFSNGYISPDIHYALHSICFVLCVLNYVILALCILKSAKPWLKYSLAASVAVIVVGRTIPNFLECYSTVWFGYFLSSLFVLSVYLFQEKNLLFFSILALLLINFSIYRSETGFVMPFAIGALSLLLLRTNAKDRKWLYWALIASALVFLSIYVFAILPDVADKYDSSHGTSVSLFGNALNILKAQKIILISIPFALYRLGTICSGKQFLCFFDVLYLTAWAMCCGGFVLKLNWVLYYNTAALYMLVFILFCCTSFNRGIVLSLVTFLALSLLYGAKIPSTISSNQQKRLEQPSKVAALSEYIANGNAVWFDPEISPDRHTVSFVEKDWIVTQLAWVKRRKDFTLPSIKAVSDNRTFDVILMSADDAEYAKETLVIDDNFELIFSESGIEAYLLK